MTKTIEFDELIKTNLDILSLESIELFLEKIRLLDNSTNIGKKYLEFYLVSCKYFKQNDLQTALEYSLKIDENIFDKNSLTYRHILLGRATIFGYLRIFNEEINIYKKLLELSGDALRFSLLSNSLVSFLRDNNYEEAKKCAPELFQYIEDDSIEDININDKVNALYNWFEVGKNEISLDEILDVFKKYEALELSEYSKMLLNEKKADIFNHYKKPDLALQLINKTLEKNIDLIDELHLTKIACHSSMLLNDKVLFQQYFSKIIQNEFTFQIAKPIDFYTEALEFALSIEYFDILKEGYRILSDLNKAYINETRNAEFMKAKVEFHNKENELKAQQLDKVEELNTQLKVANSSLEQFGAILAHDIKSPISSINMLIDVLLLKGIEESDEKEIRNQIGGSIETINNLVDNLFMFSKKGEFENEKTEFDFNEAVNLILNNNEYLIRETKAEIVLGESLAIKMNKSAFVLIMQNLILNAIKFIPKTRNPLIKVSISNKEEKKTIIIEDNGVGIKSSEVDKIFNEYYRGGNSNISKGLGLGLNTVKRIVDFYKGQIKVESKIDVGTKISLIFPEDSI